ncbi:MAG: hypothetical protein HYY09_07810 [Firmicutes bacterium]|nr:hypothetical protein [Bacillota bacterium]
MIDRRLIGISLAASVIFDLLFMLPYWLGLSDLDLNARLAGLFLRDERIYGAAGLGAAGATILSAGTILSAVYYRFFGADRNPYSGLAFGLILWLFLAGGIFPFTLKTPPPWQMSSYSAMASLWAFGVFGALLRCCFPVGEGGD